MAILENFNLKVKPVLKIAGLAVLGIIAIYIVFTIIGGMIGFLPSFFKSGINNSTSNYAPSYSVSGGKGGAAMLDISNAGQSLKLSTRNVAPLNESVSYDSPSPVGSEAENYETTDYHVSFETGQLKNTCAAVSGLKAKSEVIFETASEYNSYCNYTFKVQRDKTGEILDIIKGMKPKELANNTYTIQSEVQDFTSEITILQNKLASIDETLSKAVGAYDEVSILATKEKDVESLARVIDNKINTIRQLTQERIDINSRLDQIRRAKSEQLDKLNYTYFNVTVTDKSFFDWQDIKDSWNAAIRYSVGNINQMIQNISVNLVVFLFNLLQFAVYGLISLFVAKYGWKLVKHIWLK